MPGFLTEYAKSGRSTCKGCNKLIGQGELRIGKQVPSPHFDGEMSLWHHRACLMKREVIPNIALVHGLDNLRPEDQKSLRDEVDKKNGGAGASAIAMLDSDDKFTVEYAKSGRSTCKHCQEKIDADELRVGKLVPSSQFDGLVPNWHHEACAFKCCVIYSIALVDGLDNLRPEDKKAFAALVAKHSPIKTTAPATTDADGDVDMPEKKSKKRARKGDDEEEEPSKASKTSEVDYSKMKVDALKEQCKEQGLSTKGLKKDLVARLEEAAAAAAPSTAASAPSPAAAVDPVKAAHDKAMDDESKLKWSIKDAIGDLSTGEIKALLAANSQPNGGGRDKLMDALVDGLMYGALPACQECGNQALTFSTTEGEYACHGAASEWGRCVFKTADVKRTKFDVSEYGGGIAWFAKFKGKMNTKPLAAYLYRAGLTKAVKAEFQIAATAAEESIKARQAELLREQVRDELFEEFTFVFVGTKFPSHTAKELKKMVEAHGGTVETDIDDADLIITTPEEVAANKKKLKEAQSQKKPILLATFILDSIEKLELRDPNDYTAVDVHDSGADPWNDLKNKVESGRQKSGAKLSGAANSSNGATKSGIGKSGGGKAKVIIKGRGAVDDDSGLAESGHILEEGNNVFQETLSVADLSSGHNSFYILQLIESDKGGRFHVFRKWGRTGTDRGGNKLTDHAGSKDSAKAEFLEIFHEKTGNYYHQRSSFKKVAGKFNIIDIDYTGGDDPFADDDTKGDGAESTSKLDKRIQDLMRVFFDVSAIKKTLASMDIDLDKMPLGKLSRAHIQSGYGVLTEIQDALKDDPVNDGVLLGLSNKFFTIIPHEGTPAVLKDEKAIQEKLEMIETLLEVEIATRLMKESKAKAKEGGESKEEVSNDPIDIHYRQLKTDMVVVEKKTKEFDLISTYITNTHAPTHTNYTLDLMEAFSVDRENEGGRYTTFEKDPNRMLLWHGSRTSNFVGILSQGLRIAPPEAPVTGYMFGKGVYFADMVSKSANYCFTNTENNIGFLLLCEVALGDMNLLTHAQYMDKAPGKCLSTKGIGLTAPDPKGTVVLDNGCVVPAGKPVRDSSGSSLLYNEFIVYDVAQIRMKYLLKVRFNYKSRW